MAKQVTAEVDAYTHGYHPSVLGHHGRRTAESCAGFLLPHLHRGQTMLDVGCGPGSITMGFASHVGHVTGVDVSEVALATARANAAGKENVSFEQASVYSLPYADHTFDIVFAHQVLQHIADPVSALQEMLRVARPGGLVAVREAIGSTYQSATSRDSFSQWRALYAAIARHNGAEPDAGLFLPSWMRQAGAEPETIGYWNSVVSYSHMNGDALRAYCESWVERAKHSSFAEQAVEYGLAKTSHLNQISEGWAALSVDPQAVVLYTNGEVLGRKRTAVE